MKNVDFDGFRILSVPEVSKERKIFKSRAEYEECKAECEERRTKLRQQFLNQQVEEIPELRTMNGLEFKRLDDQLMRELDTIEQKWKTTLFVWSQSKGQGRPKDPEPSQVTYKQVSEAQAKQAMKQPGKVVRTYGEGQYKRWEVMDD